MCHSNKNTPAFTVLYVFGDFYRCEKKKRPLLARRPARVCILTRTPQMATAAHKRRSGHFQAAGQFGRATGRALKPVATDGNKIAAVNAFFDNGEPTPCINIAMKCTDMRP